MSVKCLLILSIEMIFIFDGFGDGQINKIRYDGRCHALGRSCLLYPEHLGIACLATDVPLIACVINMPCSFLPIIWNCRIFSFIL